jgi:hypothetical protein
MSNFDQPVTDAELDTFWGVDRETDPDAAMVHIRKWYAMPFGQAKVLMKAYMDDEGGYSTLDYDILAGSETAEEAIGAIFGV